MPPSITNSLPTVKAPASDARNTTACAISAGVPRRPSGIWLTSPSSASASQPEPVVQRRRGADCVDADATSESIRPTAYARAIPAPPCWRNRRWRPGMPMRALIDGV